MIEQIEQEEYRYEQKAKNVKDWLRFNQSSEYLQYLIFIEYNRDYPDHVNIYLDWCQKRIMQ